MDCVLPLESIDLRALVWLEKKKRKFGKEKKGIEKKRDGEKKGMEEKKRREKDFAPFQYLIHAAKELLCFLDGGGRSGLPGGPGEKRGKRLGGSSSKSPAAGMSVI